MREHARADPNLTNGTSCIKARFSHGTLLAGCGKSLPPQDAATSDPQNPRLFEVSPKWT
jgi:hypothetical protein